VDVLAGLTASRYDKILVHLALLAPLAMVLLGKWQASLERWYIDPDEAPIFGFNDGFQEKAAAWMQAQRIVGNKLVLITDPECACTTATEAKLKSVLSDAEQPLTRLQRIDIDSADPLFMSLIQDIPSTPTLLTVKDGVLSYAGPVSSGNFCTTAVNAVMGVSALHWETATTVYNWLERGCYCPNKLAKK
jgi:hypothetical protein